MPVLTHPDHRGASGDGGGAGLTELGLSVAAIGAAGPTGLASLKLTEEDLMMLTRQGFISCETRPGRTPRFKLRFRREGKQVVRYIGCDAGQAKSLREELAELQMRRKAERRLSAVTRQARHVLRQAKRKLEPTFHEHGLAFHGLTVRRPRCRTDAADWKD